MSMPTAIIVMAVAAIVVGAGSYAAFSYEKPEKASSSQCQPANSAACVVLAGGHDVTLLSPFAAAQVDQSVPFTAVLPPGASASQYIFNFGDNSTPVKTTLSTVTHSYEYPGQYLATVQANISGHLHDNYQSLVPISITSSSALGTAADLPGVAGVITSNSTSSTSPTAILQPGGSVTLSAAYTTAPTNPLFQESPPAIAAGNPGATIQKTSSTATSANVTVAFENSGTFVVSFIGTATQTQGGSATVHQNYVWTVFVAPSGINAGAAKTGGKTTSPHPGKLVVYEYFPGGSKTEDPSVEYDSVSGEVVANVYSQLITYNGTQAGPAPNDFVPSLAACVPGSGQCGTLFPGAPNGTNLVNLTNNAYTFVLTSASQFFDPATGNHWGVYPTDVMFSIIRTEAFGDLPSAETNPGWLVSQALLPAATASTPAMHSPYDNEPSDSFSTILVNASQYCPTQATTDPAFHGCVTFIANGGGTTWPFFLELMADPTGSSIEPCGWFSADPQAAGIPAWTDFYSDTHSNGDHPCLLPGGAKSTDSSAFKGNVSAMASTAWDTWQTDGSSPPYVGNVQWSMAGSGPYYLAGLQIGASYTFKANPDYAANPYCTWTGCLPKPGGYAGEVDGDWETSSAPGEEAYQAGIADAASIPSTETGILLQDLQQGKIQVAEAPTLSIYYWGLTMKYDPAVAQQFTTNPLTAPADFFSYDAVRQFFVHAFPYATVQANVNTVDGIEYNFAYGGAIPEFMGNYYPTNVSWPNGNPSTDPTQQGGAAWWWAQANDPSSAFYDKELSACTTSSPCTVPWFGQTGAPNVDEMAAYLVQEVGALSGGRLKVVPLDINFESLVTNIDDVFTVGYNPMAMFQLGWAPDYPDPTDYISPVYQSLYAAADFIPQQMVVPQFDNTTAGVCPYNSTDYLGWAHIAESSGIPNNCQGVAYSALNYAANTAAAMAPSAARTLLYNFVEQIANGLAFFIYWGQSNLVVTMAPWINPATPNTSVMLGGGNEQTWFSWNGPGVSG
jgi:hypothetical protein